LSVKLADARREVERSREAEAGAVEELARYQQQEAEFQDFLRQWRAEKATQRKEVEGLGLKYLGVRKDRTPP
jgi:hypothetical protein